MSQWLETLDVLAEGLDWVSSSHLVVHSHMCNSRGSNLNGNSTHMVHINTLIHINIKKSEKKN